MENDNKLVWVAIASFVLADTIPTVADSFYFKKQQQLKSDLYNEKITPSQYWKSDAFAYYTYNSLYWLLIGGIVLSVKGDNSLKLKVALGLIAGGAVFAVLSKNIKKDEAEMQKDIENRRILATQYPACYKIINNK